MFALRDAHERGATHVAVNGAHVLTGGQDGVVALFPVKRWPQTKPLWARQCHTAPVTFVVLQDDLHLAFSCGRDGHVFLHEGTHDAAAASTSRLVCRVTGEVRCMYFDAPRRRLFLGGDSLRCLKMAGTRFEVQLVPLIVPSPVVAVAITPCGRLLAMASAQGSVGVVSVADTDGGSASATAGVEASPATGAGKETPVPVRVLLDKVSLSPMAGKDDACTYRMQWCRSAAGLFLLVPTATAVAVLQYIEADGLAPAKLRSVGTLYGDGITDVFSVCAYPVTSHRLCCVIAGRSGGLYVGKVDDFKFRMARHTSQRYDEVEQGILTDVQVNEATGDIAVGLSTGRVSLLHHAAMKAMDEAKEAARKAKREAKGKTGEPPSSASQPIKTIGADSSDEDGGDEEAPKDPDDITARPRGTAVARPRERRPRNASAEEDDDFINDAATESSADSEDDDGDDENDDEASSTASSSSSSGSDSDSDIDEGGQLRVKEDLRKVVVDLKANNADYLDEDGVERPSRWRDDDPRQALAVAEREARRHKEASSRFLDDEAEEASSSDVESEDAAAYEEDGYGERHHRPNEEAEDDEEAYDGLDMAPTAGSNADGAVSPADGRLHQPLPAPAAVSDYSFQVGATPTDEGESSSCYLAYNATGFIRCTREGTTVHFHDVSNPAVRINEKGTVLMGALSPVGAGFVVAPPSRVAPGSGESIDEDEEAPRLMIYYRTFVALGAQSDWRARLQPGETVRCMAAGGRFLAVATSRYLRLYSLSGLELAVLSKFPRIVAMAGTSSRKLLASYKASFDPLAVVFLEGGEHKVEVMDVGTRTVGIPAHVLPLTEAADGTSHQLQWIGWSEDGPLHVADTAGVVRMFTQTWGGAWVPVFDPRALPDQSFNLWIWGVTDECLHAYKSSKSDPAYPVAVASGLPVERVPLFLPLTRTAAVASDRETLAWDHLLRREIRADELKLHSHFYSAAIAKHDAVHDAKIKELFLAALRAQQTSRAMDLAMMLELRDNLEDCAKEANSGGHTQLVQKLITLYELRLKSKSKRKCELPLEKAMVSEKERDELLRKLLVRERNAGKTGASGEGSGGSSGRLAPSACPNEGPTASAPGARNSSSAVVEVDAVEATSTVQRSPARSEVSTAVTATTDRTPPKQSPPQRRVTFNVPSDPSPPPASAAPAPATSVGPAAAAAKPANPFATRKGTALATALPAAPAPPTATKKTQTTLPPPRPARTTFSTGPATAMPAVPPSPVVDLIGVDSQQTLSQPQLSHTQPPTSPSSTPVHATRDAGSEGDDRSPHHADSLSPSGGRATGTSPSAEDQRPSSAAPAAAVKKATFIPKALSATADRRSPPLASASRAAVDPFLTETVESESLDTGNSGAVSVQALLQDVGHEDSLASAPRSSGFGEALRKRYREDEDNEDSSDVVLPATSLARISES